jgi:hypothetical protein
MNTKGVQLQLMIGPTVPIPAPKIIAESLESVEVTHSDEERSGFQLVFRINTSGPAGMAAEMLLNSPLFTVFNRVVLTVIFKGTPHVLMDGIITNQEHQPGAEAGGMALFTLTGEDVSLMLDREDKNAEHPAQDETIIALKIIASYAQYGLIPLVIPPFFFDPPLPVDRVPVQQATDLKYLKELAERHSYVFYITPGPATLTNTAYWGPPIRVGIPQKALSVNMDPHSNVESINIQHNALAPTTVSGKVQDRMTNQTFPVETFASLRLPLASLPDWLVHRPKIRKIQLRQSGLNVAQAYARAQAIEDRSSDEVVSVTGELDSMRYGDLLRPRSLVGLRGAGLLYDGFYYVKRVTHSIRRGTYKQSFSLAREGLGTTTPVVIP